jgi:hypothetical protein
MKKTSKKGDVADFLVQKYYDIWREENKDLLADIEELCADVVLLNAKYGTNFGLTIEEANPTTKQL